MTKGELISQLAGISDDADVQVSMGFGPKFLLDRSTPNPTHDLGIIGHVSRVYHDRDDHPEVMRHPVLLCVDDAIFEE